MFNLSYHSKTKVDLFFSVNATFAPIDRFRLLTQEYVDTYSRNIRNVLLNGDNQELIKVLLFSSDNGTEPLFETFLESPLGK